MPPNGSDLVAACLRSKSPATVTTSDGYGHTVLGYRAVDLPVRKSDLIDLLSARRAVDGARPRPRTARLHRRRVRRQGHAMTGTSDADYTIRQAAYGLRK